MSAAQTITPFFTFTGRAEEAMNFYLSLLDGSEIVEITRYGAGAPGPEGTVMLARFRLGSQEFLCSDSPVEHAWSFTPAISLFVTCDPDEIDRLFERLSEGGQVFMPLGAYPFSPKFGWVGDRFGVTWQLFVPPSAAAG
jgi:predicted 3-demethylubiquinone-9 3-methyltransferase (glyoxalase superfamily)